VASGMLMFTIFAITDQGNMPAGNLTPLILFFIIFGIGASLGWETGYAVRLHSIRFLTDEDQLGSRLWTETFFLDGWLWE